MTAERWAALTGAGLFAGAAAWALHQQTGIIIASWSCDTSAKYIWESGLLACVLLAGGGIVSAVGLGATSWLSDDTERPRRFLANISLMATGLFLFALALQMAAPFFVPGCVG